MSNNSYYNDQWRIINEPNQNKVSNYSMEFDVTGSDFIDCGNLTGLNNLSAFSTSAWINYTGVLGTKHIFISGGTLQSDRFYVQLLSSTQIRYGSGSAYNNVTTSTISSGSWHHIVTVHNGTSLDVYLDGVKQNSSPVTVVAPNANIGNDFTIGKYVLGGYEWYGKIDQVTVFDYALSATQVSTLYGGGTAVTNPMALSPKPIAAYQLGDQSVDNGANYLVPNNSLQDYVFNFVSPNFINFGNVNNFERTDSFSISMWVNIASYATYYYVSKQLSSAPFTGYILFSTSNGQLQFLFNNTFSSNTLLVNSTSQIPLNQWVHLTSTYDGSSLASGVNMYFNGVPETIITVNNTLTASTLNTTDFQISGRDGGGVNLIGDVSNVSIFNTELSSPQVEAIYNNGSPNDISSLNPVSWWKLNAADTFDSSTSTWTINDYGSGSNDGTSSGMTSANLVQSDLQHTSGYSPYALDFDGTNDYLDLGTSLSLPNEYTISSWININNTTAGAKVIVYKGSNSSYEFGLEVNRTSGKLSTLGASSGPVFTSNTTLAAGVWYHAALTKAVVGGTKTYTFFLNGQPDGTGTTTVAPNYIGGITAIGRFGSSSGGYFNGEISNLALWNSVLTSTQITEIYNQGVPSNLNTFSGTKPTSWWQLGSNSSFNTNWTCLNEGSVTGSNAVSAGGMTNDDIVNGVGYSANGLGTSSIDIKGDAPYSTANGLSENMDVLDRSTDVPS